MPLQLSALKRYRLKRLGEKRQFPKTVYSTADYVRDYYRLNNLGSTEHFAPLNETRAAWPTGIDTVETVEEGAE